MERKEVNFNGAKLLVFEINYKYYVSMKHVCKGLGLTESQRKYIVNKFNKDGTLKVCRIFYPVKTIRGVKETSLIELDYLPLWLAKINPARFSKELKDKLLEYQLHAKDVLAAAFLDNKPKQLPLPTKYKLVRKYYNGVPVMGVLDLSLITGINRATIIYKLGNNKTLIHKNEITKFKEENPNLPSTISNMTIMYKEEVVKVCKSLKVYDKVKTQIIEYFDDVQTEKPKEGEIPQLNENLKKAEILVLTLNHIKDRSLKELGTYDILNLVDDTILKDHESLTIAIKLSKLAAAKIKDKEGYKNLPERVKNYMELEFRN